MMIHSDTGGASSGSRSDFSSTAPPSYFAQEAILDSDGRWYAPSEDTGSSGGSTASTQRTPAGARAKKGIASNENNLPGPLIQSYTTNNYNNYSEYTPLAETLQFNKPAKWVLPWKNNLFRFLIAIIVVQLCINVYSGKILARIDWEQLEKMRGQWKIEVAAHDQERKIWDIERQAFELEREKIEQARKEVERVLEEQRRREEQERLEREERIRLGLYWDEVQGSDYCYASGTREYTARLMNLPATYDGMKGCRSTPITIHDVTVDHPYKCENRGFLEGMYGHFLVKSGETACSPYWGAFNDKGCTAEGSHTRRIESRLLNILQGENWNRMCSTTPADFRNLHFEGPRYCIDKGVWGMYGVWEVEDSAC